MIYIDGCQLSFLVAFKTRETGKRCWYIVCSEFNIFPEEGGLFHFMMDIVFVSLLVILFFSYDNLVILYCFRCFFETATECKRKIEALKTHDDTEFQFLSSR